MNSKRLLTPYFLSISFVIVAVFLFVVVEGFCPLFIISACCIDLVLLKRLRLDPIYMSGDRRGPCGPGLDRDRTSSTDYQMIKILQTYYVEQGKTSSIHQGI